MQRPADGRDSERRRGSSLARICRKFSLTAQFALAAGIVMLGGMLVLGNWVEEQIRDGVTRNAAASTALLLDSFVTPLAQELKDTDSLTIGPVLALDELMNRSSFGQNIVSLRIWKPQGIIAYSDDLSLVGKSFEPSKSLVEASKGEVVSKFILSGQLDHVRRSEPDRPLLEIYSPLRAQWTGEVIAVVEFYEDAGELAQTLGEARRTSWLIVGSVTLAMILVLMTIVDSGTELISKQRRSLEKALDENRALLRRVERASGRSAALSEQHLRRVSADLHDGPAQLVSFAALRLGSLGVVHNDQNTQNELAVITRALGDAMQDIRDICNGLSLPEIENQSLEEIVGAVVGAHQARTGTPVEVTNLCDALPMAPHIKICLYRFLQEGLNNAFRHGGGKNQRVIINMDGMEAFEIRVLNALGKKSEAASSGGIGLKGLQERVEALGGSFDFSASPQKGARLYMRLEMNAGAEA